MYYVIIIVLTSESVIKPHELAFVKFLSSILTLVINNFGFYINVILTNAVK